MSQKEPTEMETKDLTVACDYCGAGVGEWCTTPAGQRYAQYLHAIRFYASQGVQ